MTCGCSNGGLSGCGSCATPAPHYNQAGTAIESHDIPVLQQVLVAALSTGSEFAMPAAGVEAIVTFNALAVLQVGCYLWNATIGYLRVTAFNPLTGETKLINDEIPGNAMPGKLVPRCSLFTITAPPWNGCIQCASGSSYVYVFPAGPCPIPEGDPFSMDIVSIDGDVVTLGWHSVVVQP